MLLAALSWHGKACKDVPGTQAIILFIAPRSSRWRGAPGQKKQKI